MILKKQILRNQNGASAILVILTVAMLLGFTALAIDVGYMYSTRNELQNVADAAALAGAGKLGQIYLTLSYVDQQAFNVDASSMGYRTQINTALMSTAVQNKAAGANISIDSADITIGTWDFTASNPATALTPANITPDAVRVIARRDSTMNSPVATFFGFIFSFFGGSANTFNVSAVATASLSGPAEVAEGVIKAPIGISENNLCGGPLIEFSPTTSSCAGWHNYFDPINANAMKAKMIGLIEGYEENGNQEGHHWLNSHYDINKAPTPEVTPEAGVGDYFEFQGGVIAALFASGGYYPSWTDKDNPGGAVEGNDKKPIPFINLFDFFRFRDGDGSGTDTINICGTTMLADSVWTTTIPVYEDGSTCTNPNTAIKIVGYANVHIIAPNPPPDNNIEVCFDCDKVVEPGRGGGSTGNVLGSIPSLVQ